jgi:pantoate--beta-alanine ligase
VSATREAATIAVLRKPADLRAEIGAWRRAGLSVGLVPTMGALHAGHLSLVERALAECDRCVATIFVNPKQFGPDEDFASYPRQESADAARLQAAGASLLYAPGVEEIYPRGFATAVRVAGLTEHLCGPHRPGHFTGVATVVTKLLLQALPDIAVFGDKDFQQLQVIRRLVRDLDIPVRIVGAPTVRESDGLAMSSRNVNLTPAERAIAPRLYRRLREAARGLAEGRSTAELLAEGREALAKAGFAKIDYFELCDVETLAPIAAADRPARLFAAGWLGRTRLIDNIEVEPARRG